MAAYVRCSLLCGIQGSGRRDGRDVVGERGRSWLRPLSKAIVFCAFPLSRCFASSEQSVAIMFLKL